MTRIFMGVGIIVGKPWWNCSKLLLVMVIFFFRNVIIDVVNMRNFNEIS